MSNKKGRFSKRKRSGMERTVVICLILLIVVLAGLIGWTLLNRGNSGEGTAGATLPVNTEAPVQTDAHAVPTETTAPPATEPQIPSAIPCVVAEGKLQISSIFEYSGANPDCDWENGDNICGLVLENISDEHLVYARIELEMSDGSQFLFEAEQIPGGETVWLFERNNQSTQQTNICVATACSAEFQPETLLMQDKVEIDVSGMEINITNQSAEAIPNVEVTCHSVLDNVYFGGTAYTYYADMLPADSSVTVLAEDCFLETAEVVALAAVEDIE